MIDPEARYRGAENQLYRVEIHRGGAAEPGGATFKWSRENGSVAFPILRRSDATDTVTVALGSLGRDRRLGLREHDWVELSDDNTTLSGERPPLLVVASIDRDEFEVVLKGTTTSQVGEDPAAHPVLRRWDHDGTTGDDGALTVVASADPTAWIDLEDGIQIQFPTSEGPASEYRAGDYWLVPARTATGDVEWPRTNGTIADALPPRGIVHHDAPLAIVHADGQGEFTVETPDCRVLFEPMKNVNEA